GDTFFELSGKVYERPGDDFGFPIIVDTTTMGSLLDSGDLTSIGGGGGAELRFGSTGPRGENWEIRSFLANWSDVYGFEQDNLSSPLSPDLDPGEIDLTYDSQIFSLEFNFRKPVAPGIQFITGPRIISLTEQIEFTTETIIPNPPFPDSQVNSENNLEVDNTLLGGQIGALINYPISRDIYVHGFIRAGGYANFMDLLAEGDTSLTDPTSISLNRTDAAFVGETGGKIYYDVIPGIMAGFVGYEATWIDNVALAPTNATTLTPTEIVSGVTPFYHAITFGVNWRR
ncbi:MAG: hypothetical protein AAGA30_21430, partial [Planctomycetota bacterium]